MLSIALSAPVIHESTSGRAQAQLSSEGYMQCRFCVHNLTGKFSAVLGPLLWGATLALLDPRVFGRFAYQVAIATLLLMVLLGLGLHQLTPNIKRK